MNLLHCCCCCCCTMAPNARITRKWELYAGRNKFYCDGLLMSAPHTGVFYLTCVLITGTSALFFAFDCPFLAIRITPAIPIVGAVLYFFTMSSLLRTTFTDPGVIPRASYDEAAYIEKQIEVPNSLNSPTYRPPPRTKEVLVKGQTVKLKYCFTCKIFRPPRASHCSLCDNCVDRFDHHCPWVGNCVGKRNYRFFYMFLVSLAFLAVFIFSCSVTHLVLLMKTEQEVLEVIRKAPFTVIVVFVCFFSIWSVIGLAGFHTYLTTSDQTTNEDLKGSFSSKGGQRAINPYSRGNICLNCCHILCGPMAPSLIDRRGVATDEYILQMQQQTSPRHPLSDVLSATQVSSAAALISNQPILSSIGGNESRLYDESAHSTTALGGVYRPHSYDNLQNGNSNSLAHLVDNEIPLSQIDTTLQAPQHQAAAPTYSSNNNSNENQNGNAAGDSVGAVVVDNTEVIAAVAAIAATHKATTMRSNMSGSYNNLFHADYDAANTTIDATAAAAAATTTTPTTPATPVTPTTLRSTAATTIATPTCYNNMSSASIAPPQAAELPPATSLATAAAAMENLYSNVPNNNIAIIAGDNMLVVGTPTTPPNIITHPTAATAAAAHNSISPIVECQALQHDPSLHVYSNLVDERQHRHNSNNEQRQLSRSNNVHKSNGHTKHAAAFACSSSHLLTDDLYLDDPMSASFVVQQTTGPTAATSNKSSSNAKRKLGVVAIEGSPFNVAAANSAAAAAIAVMPESRASASVANALTPSRLRLLHDTTMIDTALDLDSLDGCILGGNSGSGAVGVGSAAHATLAKQSQKLQQQQKHQQQQQQKQQQQHQQQQQ